MYVHMLVRTFFYTTTIIFTISWRVITSFSEMQNSNYEIITLPVNSPIEI